MYSITPPWISCVVEKVSGWSSGLTYASCVTEIFHRFYVGFQVFPLIPCINPLVLHDLLYNRNTENIQLCLKWAKLHLLCRVYSRLGCSVWRGWAPGTGGGSPRSLWTCRRERGTSPSEHAPSAPVEHISHDTNVNTATICVQSGVKLGFVMCRLGVR